MWSRMISVGSTDFLHTVSSHGFTDPEVVDA